MGSASYLFTFVFIFRNLLWGSVNNGQPLHGLHNTKRLRTTAVKYCTIIKGKNNVKKVLYQKKRKQFHTTWIKVNINKMVEKLE